MLDEDTFARKIVACLGHQPGMPAGIAYRLRQVRERALIPKAVARSGMGRIMQLRYLGAGAGIALILIALAFATLPLYNKEPDLADLDAQLLTSDLPVAAYLDSGFARFEAGTGR